jgi:hypothetical protein
VLSNRDSHKQGGAIGVTIDSTGQVFTFRSEIGQPLWSGGNGKGNGGNH